MALPLQPEPDELLTHDAFVRAVARRLLDDEHRVDDVVQETWLAALRRGPRGAGSLRAWLAAVVRNLAIDSRRRDAARRERERRAAQPDRVPSMEEIYAREAVRRRLIDAVAALPEASRSVFLLRYFEGLPPRKIAARLAIPVETVKTRLKRGLDAVRAKLDAEGPLEGKSWSVWLAPLAAGSGPLLPAALGRAAARTAEVLTMSTKTKIGIAAALLAGLSVFLWQVGSGPRADSGSGGAGGARSEGPAALAAKPQESALAAAAAATSPAARESAASTPAPAKPMPSIATGGLRVKAVWKEGKAPAAAVGLRIRTFGAPRSFESQQRITGSDGIALFPALPAGRALVDVDRTVVSLLVEIPTGDTREVTVEIDSGGDADVTVVDAYGAPVEGAAVWISDPHNSATSRLELGKTAADGRFAVRALAKEVFLGAAHESRAPAAPARVQPKPGERIAVRLVLDLPGCVVEGRVAGADGRPVAGCAVLLGNDEPLSRPDESAAEAAARRPIPTIVKTDAAGKFRAAGLAAGSYAVAARAEGHGLFVGSVEAIPGAPVPLEIALPAPAAVVGRILDSAGRPLEGARVHTAGPRSFLFLECASGADGRYRLEDLGPGRTEVQANFGQAPSASTTFYVEAGAELRWDPIFPASPEIRGRVVDESGAPLRGWLVRAVEASLNGRVFGLPKITTDEQGRFLVPRCKNVEYIVEVLEPATPQKGEAFDEVRAASGTAEHVRPGLDELVIVVTPETRPNCTVTGTVVDPEGRPVGNAAVLAGAAGSAAMTQIAIDPSTAAFRVGPIAAARKHRLRIDAPGFTTKTLPIDGLVPNATRDLGAIAMERGGTVLVEARRADGALPEKLTAFISPGDGSGEGLGDVLVREGPSFRSKPLTAGKYSVLFLGGDVARARVAVEIADGKETRADILLQAGHARSITVARPGGAPTGVVTVRVSLESGAFVSDEAAFAVGGEPIALAVRLVAGRYKLEARDESGAKGEARLDVAGADPSPVRIEIR